MRLYLPVRSAEITKHDVLSARTYFTQTEPYKDQAGSIKKREIDFPLIVVT